MRHHTATLERVHEHPNESPASDSGADTARTWLLHRLRWENRLRQLRQAPNGAHNNIAQRTNPGA
jgi:hypothetical protein